MKAYMIETFVILCLNVKFASNAFNMYLKIKEIRKSDKIYSRKN